MTENKGDLISREALKNEVDTWGCNDYDKYDFIEAIDNAPTVDTDEIYKKGYHNGFFATHGEPERPQGEWIKHIDNLFPEESTEECPFCHEEQILIGNDDNFCPNCGADMRGKEE